MTSPDILKSLRGYRLAVYAALLVGMPVGSSADTPASEYAVKAAIVFKIAKFVYWPETEHSSKNDVLSICLPENDPIGPSIDALRGEKIHGRRIEVQRLSAVKSVTTDCEILYLSRPSADRHGALLDRISKSPVLTIGDGGNFVESGGIIALEIKQSRVQFAINVRASQRAGLDISAQLLQLATIKD
jgi:hypothetical protein